MVSKFTGEHQKRKSIHSRPRERLTVVKVLAMVSLLLISRKKGNLDSKRGLLMQPSSVKILIHFLNLFGLLEHSVNILSIILLLTFISIYEVVEKYNTFLKKN